jgi:hypothetical protein
VHIPETLHPEGESQGRILFDVSKDLEIQADVRISKLISEEAACPYRSE